MATLVELARAYTSLEGSALDHLQRLVASWGFLADLCFADLLIYVPVHAATAAAGPEPDAQADGQATGGNFIVLGQIRPTTSQTLYGEDQIGRIVTLAERSLVARAWELGEIIDGESHVNTMGEIASVECIPVRWKDEMVGVMTRESAPSVGRRPGELERIYVDIFDRFARMIASGEFPFGAEDTEPEEAPRVGDGLALLDGSARVEYASPNYVSALHRMGIHGNMRGARLGELGFEESPVRFAFAIGLPITEEVERGNVTVLVRCLPLLDQGTVTGAVLIMRDVSDVRRRDRLLLTKDATIREIHHRVKNNLQTISSLLRLHARRLESPEAREAIEESVRRVRSIALVHDTLAGGSSQELAFGEIVRPLVRMVEEGLLSPDRPVTFEVQGDAGELRAEVATPLSVALAELLQNAVEHGFPYDDPRWVNGAKAGKVVVSMTNDGRELVVRVADNGVGLPEGFSLDETPTLGLTIVRTLVTTELRGRLSVRSENGTVAEMRVPVAAGLGQEAPAPAPAGGPHPLPA